MYTKKKHIIFDFLDSSLLGKVSCIMCICIYVCLFVYLFLFFKGDSGFPGHPGLQVTSHP